MVHFKILSDPISNSKVSYKGLYRSEPYPKPLWNDEVFMLWHKYTSYVTKKPGITDEMTVDEMLRFVDTLTKYSDKAFELIYFSDEKVSLFNSDYYGIDIVGAGGYSVIGDMPTVYSDDKQSADVYRFLHKSNLLNAYGLIKSIESATAAVEMMKSISDNSIEPEDWHIVHVYKVNSIQV